jgi:hypothetical protein
MIFVLAAAVAFTVWRFTLASRREGLYWAIREMLLAIASGLLAGVFVGLGARAGMSAIAFANGDASRFTLSGTVAVIVTFAGFGGIFGIIYAGLFRQILKQRGLVFGLLIMLVSWYPLANAAAQQLRNSPPIILLILSTAFFVSLMWIPFGLVLEKLVSKWQITGTVSINVNPIT